MADPFEITLVADDAGRPSEADLRTLFDHAGDMIVSIAPSGKLIHCNPAWLATLGYDWESMVGRGIFEFVAVEDRAACEDLFQRILAGDDINRIEASFLSSRGGVVFVEGRCHCSSNDAGEVVAVHAIWRDVTLAKREREILEAIATGEPVSNTLYRLTEFIESVSPELIASVLVLDIDGETLRHGAAPSLPNAYIEKIDGLVIGDSVGSCGTAAFRGEPVFVDDIITNPLWADYRELAIEHDLAACWSTPVKDTAGNVLGTFAIYSRTAGKCTPENKRRIEFATHLAALAIGRDRAESAMRASEEKFATAFRSSPDAIVLTELETGQVVDVNEHQSEITGYSRNEVIGKTTLELNIWGQSERRDEFINRLEREGAVRNFVTRLVTKSGETGIFSINAETISIDDVPHILATVRDVTEREQLFERIRRSEARLAHAEQIAHVGNWSYDLATGEIELSEELYRIYGRERSESINYDSLMSWIHKQDHPRLEQFLTQLKNASPGDVIGNLEYRLFRPDGEMRWIEAVVDIEFDEAGAPVRYFGTALDITHRKAIEESAKQAAVAADRLESLTPREREVFDQVVEGLANKVIAHEMAITEKTVEKHRSNVMKKLRARSVPDLVRLSIAAGQEG